MPNRPVEDRSLAVKVQPATLAWGAQSVPENEKPRGKQIFPPSFFSFSFTRKLPSFPPQTGSACLFAASPDKDVRRNLRDHGTIRISVPKGV